MVNDYTSIEIGDIVISIRKLTRIEMEVIKKDLRGYFLCKWSTIIKLRDGKEKTETKVEWIIGKNLELVRKGLKSEEM